MSAKQRCVHRSKTYYQIIKHFDNVFATGGNKTFDHSIVALLFTTPSVSYNISILIVAGEKYMRKV